MAIAFNADEIFSMAEQIERNGAKFYRKAAKGTGGARQEAMLLELAEMEVDHEKTFKAMHAELGTSDRMDAPFDPEGQAQLFLQAVADGHVFDVDLDPSEKLTGDETLADILTTALGLEKDSIVFYLGMKSAVREDLGKDKIDAIIAEELGHVAKLSKVLAEV
jgi:rubrerythrin